MSDTLPMFPLNSVLFPGMSVPLRVFEDRYRALVHHLLRVDDPTDRIFGSVGIREGYEVGEHGAQWLFRIGCRVKMTEVEAYPDGTFELVAVGLDRIELEHLDTSGAYPVGKVTQCPEHDVDVPEGVQADARDVYDAYCDALLEIDRDPPASELPHDPTYLSWALAALAPLTMSQRQALLEAEDATGRLRMVTDVIRGELRTMRVFPSLPATEIARTRWSPN
jgi:Lon protease-like protein